MIDTEMVNWCSYHRQRRSKIFRRQQQQHVRGNFNGFKNGNQHRNLDSTTWVWNESNNKNPSMVTILFRRWSIYLIKRNKTDTHWMPDRRGQSGCRNCPQRTRLPRRQEAPGTRHNEQFDWKQVRRKVKKPPQAKVKHRPITVWTVTEGLIIIIIKASSRLSKW